MASTKGKAGINNESSSGRDSGRTDAGSPTISAGAASLTTNRTYTLDDLDTIATVASKCRLATERVSQAMFCSINAFPAVNTLPTGTTTCTLEHYLEYVLWLSGSSLTVGEVDKDPIAPQSQPP
ncbi:hypothetical protein DPX16_14034 [Anabarilius grahami]|uniref:Uncharacterized protein n=1 Tax=Anabarilius grahami TaxID=495550 RepID=A0A3N0Y8Z7_ANAGA|nr:hypothetical protein DPX16_14034 [Anabarilius grahami]